MYIPPFWQDVGVKKNGLRFWIRALEVPFLGIFGNFGQKSVVPLAMINLKSKTCTERLRFLLHCNMCQCQNIKDSSHYLNDSCLAEK